MNDLNNEFQIGMVYLCKVISISKNYFEVLTTNKTKGIVYVNEISDYFVNDLNKIVAVNDILYLTLKEIKKDGSLYFSFKENKSYFLRTPFEFNIDESPDKHEFQNLFNFTNERIKKWKK